MNKRPIDYSEMVEALSDFLPAELFDKTVQIINKYLDDYIPVSYMNEYMKHHDPVCQVNLTTLIENYCKGVDPDGCKG